jgi:ABC-type sugar transport system ATPase subunit
MQTALRLTGLQKSFGGVTALCRGDLEVHSGEVHLLLGENGAGKSTMMKLAAGMLSPDGGSISVHGCPVCFASPRQAQDAGIAMVHQESLLAPHLTVAENLFLGREEVGRFNTLKPRATLEAARRLITRHRFPLDPAGRVGRLGPAGRQLVEICRALVFDASILIFDEPTSSLSEAEAAQVFAIIDDLRRLGRAVIYITHRIEELRRLGDRATVLRDGATVFSGGMGEVSNDELIRHMVGRALSGSARRTPASPGREVLRATGLTRRGVFEDISFSLRAGEVLGLAGLIGAGRTEICRALFGIDPFDRGEVHLEGRPYRPHSPRDAVRAGLALVPEDRQVCGIAAQRSLAENMSIAALPRFSPRGILDLKAELAGVAEMTARLNLRASSPSQRAGQLSGGNQQKAVLAKWLLARSRVFLLDEPACGIDIAAKSEVAALIDELARQGAAILLVSSELPELLRLADRILVLRRGRIAAELPGQTTQEEVLRFAALA